MTYTVYALIQNKPSVLAQMTAIFSRRDVSIDSLTLGASEQSGVSRVQMTARGEEEDVTDVMLQLRSLRDVLSVQNISEDQMSYYVAAQINESYM